MPLYDYQCTDCSHEFEVLQGINDDVLTNCPECKQDTLKKQASAPAFTFKGGGWYKDLYSSSGSDKGKSDSSGKSKESSSSKSTSEKSSD